MKAAVYLRMSIDDPVGIDRQREDCTRICADKGWTPIEFVDNDRTASKDKPRPAYEWMLADIHDDEIGAVVAWDLDRLHRRPIELEPFMDLADGKHLALATVSGDVDLSTAQGRRTARLKGVVARHEVEHKSDRQRRAYRQKAERGLPHWRRAFGYLDDIHQPDPVTAPLVREAYAAILAGASLSDVCALFNDAGAFTVKGNPWGLAQLSLFLRSPRNAGLRSDTRDKVTEIVGKGTWPPLVDEATWRQVQSVLDGPGRAPGRKSVRKHLLTGVLGCGNCGHYLSGKQTTERRITYSCKACGCVSIRAHHVEPLIYALVSGRLAKPDAVDLLRAELHDAAEAEALRTEANTLTAELDTLALERADGLLTSRQVQIATARIQEKLAAIEARQQDQERLRVFYGIPLGTPQVAAAVEKLSPNRLRAVIAVLMTVTIEPVGKGHWVAGERFDPERVKARAASHAELRRLS